MKNDVKTLIRQVRRTHRKTDMVIKPAICAFLAYTLLILLTRTPLIRSFFVLGNADFFLVSIISFTLIYIYDKAVNKKNKLNEGDLLYILFHEVTHAVFAGVFLNKVTGININAGSGETKMSGNSNWLIKLAPYSFPLFSGILLLMSFMIKTDFLNYFNYIMLFFYVYHLYYLKKYFSYQQPDIYKSGKLFSTIFILLCNINIFFIIYTNYVYGWEGLVNLFTKLKFITGV